MANPREEFETTIKTFVPEKAKIKKAKQKLYADVYHKIMEFLNSELNILKNELNQSSTINSPDSLSSHSDIQSSKAGLLLYQLIREEDQATVTQTDIDEMQNIIDGMKKKVFFDDKEIVYRDKKSLKIIYDNIEKEIKKQQNRIDLYLTYINNNYLESIQDKKKFKVNAKRLYLLIEFQVYLNFTSQNIFEFSCYDVLKSKINKLKELANNKNLLSSDQFLKSIKELEEQIKNKKCNEEKAFQQCQGIYQVMTQRLTQHLVDDKINHWKKRLVEQEVVNKQRIKHTMLKQTLKKKRESLKLCQETLSQIGDGYKKEQETLADQQCQTKEYETKRKSLKPAIRRDYYLQDLPKKTLVLKEKRDETEQLAQTLVKTSSTQSQKQEDEKLEKEKSKLETDIVYGRKDSPTIFIAKQPKIIDIRIPEYEAVKEKIDSDENMRIDRHPDLNADANTSIEVREKEAALKIKRRTKEVDGVTNKNTTTDTALYESIIQKTIEMSTPIRTRKFSEKSSKLLPNSITTTLNTDDDEEMNGYQRDEQKPSLNPYDNKSNLNNKRSITFAQTVIQSEATILSTSSPTQENGLRKSYRVKSKRKENYQQEIEDIIINILELIHNDQFIGGVKALDLFLCNEDNIKYLKKHKKAENLMLLIQLINHKVIVGFAETFSALAYDACKPCKNINFNHININQVEKINYGTMIFNLLAAYVQDDILLSSRNENSRDLVIERWIMIASYLHNNGDFFSTSAIISALYTVPIYRIYETKDVAWVGLSDIAQHTLLTLDEHYNKPGGIDQLMQRSKEKNVIEPLFRVMQMKMSLEGSIENAGVPIGIIEMMLKKVESKRKQTGELNDSDRNQLNAMLKETIKKVNDEDTQAESKTFEENLNTLNRLLIEAKKTKASYEADLDKLQLVVTYKPESDPIIRKSIEYSLFNNMSENVKLQELIKRLAKAEQEQKEIRKTINASFSEISMEQPIVKLLKNIADSLKERSQNGINENQSFEKLKKIQEDAHTVSDGNLRNKLSALIENMQKLVHYNLDINDLSGKKENDHNQREEKLYAKSYSIREKGDKTSTISSKATKLLNGDLTFPKEKFDVIIIQAYHHFYINAYRDLEDIVTQFIAPILGRLDAMKMYYSYGTKPTMDFEIKDMLEKQLENINKNMGDERTLYVKLIMVCNVIRSVVQKLYEDILKDKFYTKLFDHDELNNKMVIDFNNAMECFLVEIDKKRTIGLSIWNDRDYAKTSSLNNGLTTATTTMTYNSSNLM